MCVCVCVCVKDPAARLDVDCRQRRRIQSDCSAEGTEVEEGVRRSASKVIVSRNATLLRRYERERERRDTRCYFNMQSKADTSQLNLPHGTNNQNVKK